jgi:predicted RNA binding protein YcfA (HicA-like mRNA interferase family)
MKSMSGKELAKLLEANGWDLLRIQGSHHIYGKVGNSSRISVPIHRNQDMKIGLLRNLLKTADLLSMFEGKSDSLRETLRERAVDESNLEIEIDPSTAEETIDIDTIDEIETELK